jgi:hypothetical protein
MSVVNQLGGLLHRVLLPRHKHRYPQLEKETDLVVKTSLIGAVGSLRYDPAVPALAKLILDKETSPDHGIGAVESVGKIVKTPFSAASDPVAAATVWLNANGYATAEDVTRP